MPWTSHLEALEERIPLLITIVGEYTVASQDMAVVAPRTQLGPARWLKTMYD